jgi:hypothetical protein
MTAAACFTLKGDDVDAKINASGESTIPREASTAIVIASSSQHATLLSPPRDGKPVDLAISSLSNLHTGR